LQLGGIGVIDNDGKVSSIHLVLKLEGELCTGGRIILEQSGQSVQSETGKLVYLYSVNVVEVSRRSVG
jgi:hypothetical protein